MIGFPFQVVIYLLLGLKIDGRLFSARISTSGGCVSFDAGGIFTTKSHLAIMKHREEAGPAEKGGLESYETQDSEHRRE